MLLWRKHCSWLRRSRYLLRFWPKNPQLKLLSLDWSLQRT